MKRKVLFLLCSLIAALSFSILTNSCTNDKNHSQSEQVSNAQQDSGNSSSENDVGSSNGDDDSSSSGEQASSDATMLPWQPA